MHRGGQQSLFCRRKAVAEDERETEGPDIEEEASIFAAALLMPRVWVQHYWEECEHDHGAMCKIFKTSGAAMGRRLHTAM